jgi:conjugative transfer region lipoprotein (TIGR03751 family)
MAKGSPASPTTARRICSTSLLLLAAAGTAAGSVGACTSKESILPEDGPTMLEIYRGHFQAGAGSGPDSRPPGTPAALAGARPGLQAALAAGPGDTALADTDLAAAGYTRTALSEHRQLFPRLPNPDVILYVAPHLAGRERLPVPGYTTAFPLFERPEYALPGDLPPPAAAEPPPAPPPPGPPAAAPPAAAPLRQAQLAAPAD